MNDLAIGDEPIWVFLDETRRRYAGGRDLSSVAAVVASSSDLTALESAVVAIHEDILATPHFWYDEGANERKEAFRTSLHATEMNVSMRDYARERLARLPFRIHVAYSVHDPSEDLTRRYALLYESILTKIYRRYRNISIGFVFEQHEQLSRYMLPIAAEAGRRARDPRVPQVLRQGESLESRLESAKSVIVAQADKTVPGCAIADLVLFDFGLAAVHGYIDPDLRQSKTAFIVRNWTNMLAERVAYEYDFDRDIHRGRYKRESRLPSY